MWITRRRMATPLHPAPGRTPPVWWPGSSCCMEDPWGRRIQRTRQAVILRLHSWRCTDENPIMAGWGDSTVGGITPCQAGKRESGRVEGSLLPEFLAFWRELFRVLRERDADGAGACRTPSCSVAGSLQNGRDARSLARPQGRVGRRRPWPGAPFPRTGHRTRVVR